MRPDPTLQLASPDDTTRLGKALAPLLRAGDVVLLEGPIGAGKTHFARAVIQSRLADLGRSEDVPSPTFTLVQTYDAGETEIWHADLYRLSTPDELIELGLDDARIDAILLIEWPDRLGADMPDPACKLAFTVDGDGRGLSVDWPDPRCATWLESFAAHA